VGEKPKDPITTPNEPPTTKKTPVAEKPKDPMETLCVTPKEKKKRKTPPVEKPMVPTTNPNEPQTTSDTQTLCVTPKEKKMKTTTEEKSTALTTTSGTTSSDKATTRLVAHVISTSEYIVHELPNGKLIGESCPLEDEYTLSFTLPRGTVAVNYQYKTMERK
jgi:hypothetical protein